MRLVDPDLPRVRYVLCVGCDKNVLSNGTHTNDNNTTAPSSYLSIDVLSNGNNTNDNNSTAPSSSLYAVTVAVSLPWVRRVYCYQFCMPVATNYVLSDGNVLYVGCNPIFKG